jgi:hypothetical protein
VNEDQLTFGYLEGADGAIFVQGHVDHDSEDIGYPIKIGGKASTSKPVAVANGDRVNAYYDEYGQQYVELGDKPARDLGKVDVALLDQYTPIDVDSGAPTVNALPVILRVAGAGGVSITGDATYGLDVDITDKPARDLGKVDIATIDQYTPIDVDTDGTTNILNALPITWRKASSGGAEFGTASNPVVVDTELPAAAALADGAVNPTTPMIGAAALICNTPFATWERQHGNIQGTVIASAARTASYDGADQLNRNGRGLFIHIVASAPVDTPSVVFTVQGKGSAGNYFNLLESVAITGAGTTTLTIAPWAAAVANVSATSMVPRQWRVISTHADADSITYGVYYDLGV